MRVARINTTPVRTFRLQHPDSVEVGPDGVVENRRFLLVDEHGERLRSSKTAWPCVLEAHYDAAAETLRVRFPDGSEFTESALGDGEAVTPEVAARRIPARVVHGGWEAGLAELAGHPVRIVRAERPRDAFRALGPVSLLSTASVDRLAEVAGRPVDARRFRLLFEVDGCEAHEEDRWYGRSVRVGEAVLRIGRPVERCAVTTRDPDTGARDLDTLRLIRSYRGQRAGDGAILFGVVADVEWPGTVRVGDPVELL